MEQYLPKSDSNWENNLSKFKRIDTVIFDVDGVLTNSDLIVMETGELLRKMHTRDGYALRRAVQAGLHVVVITGGKSKGVAIRLQNLGIEHIYTGVDDKLAVYENFVHQFELDEDRILFMGDDIPDL